MKKNGLTSGHLAAKILNAVCEKAKEGVTTLELNDRCCRFCSVQIEGINSSKKSNKGKKMKIKGSSHSDSSEKPKKHVHFEGTRSKKSSSLGRSFSRKGTNKKREKFIRDLVNNILKKDNEFRELPKKEQRRVCAQLIQDTIIESVRIRKKIVAKTKKT